MSFLGFTERGTKDVIVTSIINNSNYILLFGVGAIMFFLSLLYIFPNDLFTSALFFDGLQLQQVFSQPAKMFSSGIWAGLPDLSTEAFAFAASLACLQVFLGYRSSTASGPGLFSGVKQITQGKRIDASKLKWFLAYVAVATFDTWTDTEYRSFYGQQSLYLKALITSFFFYNLFSEWALVQGSKLMINYGFVLLQMLKPGKNRGMAGAPQPPRNNQGQQGGQKPQQQQNQSRKNKNRGGIPQQQNGRPNQNPQQQQRPDPRFDPRAMNPIVMPGMRLVDDEADRD